MISDEVVISQHAESRARTRLLARTAGAPEARAVIEAELDSALDQGRWSRRPPRWFRATCGQRRAQTGTWFAWSERRRVLFVMADLVDGRRIVVTVIRREKFNYVEARDG